jgi:microcystin-dependent protein
MSTPFIGEVRIFAGSFAPVGWSLCNGQILAISQYDALFALIGTTYGGDGVTTFALPDLQCRVPLHFGTGPGLSSRVLGENSGTEQVTLNTSQMPAHTHPPLGLGAKSQR